MAPTNRFSSGRPSFRSTSTSRQRQAAGIEDDLLPGPDVRRDGAERNRQSVELAELPGIQRQELQHVLGTVTDHEAVTRRIIDFCGLDWDDACLQFHKTERVVKTASTWQVRQPLYSTSFGRWRHYEKQLEPLKHALGDAYYEINP